MINRSTLINLIAVGLASGVLLLYGLTQLLVGVLFDSTYPVQVTLPETGGLLADKQVTYNGAAVGKVEDVELLDDRVLVSMAIDEGVEIPAEVDVVVLRSSPVGEQALDLRPIGDGGAPFVEPGSTIQAREVALPTEIQPLLELAADVFEPVDPEQAGVVVSELADAVRNRRDDVRGFLDDSARFSETIADRGEDYDRFFASSRRVNAALADSRETLGRLFGEIADATTILRDVRGDYERLLATGPPVLAQAGDIVHRAQPNLSCSLADLAAVNAYVAEDERLDRAAEALRVNQFFFEGFNRITQQDARGANWQRIHFASEPIPPARSYLPEKRPIPPTMPGGACDSPFGEGAPMAAQDDFALVVPEGRVDEPADDRATPVRRDPLPRSGRGAQDEDSSDRAGSARSDDDRLAREDPDEPAESDEIADADEPGPGVADTGLVIGMLVIGGLGVLAAGWGTLRATVLARRGGKQ